jgi:predicted nucleic acid-binding protein
VILVVDASVAVKWLFPDPAVEPDADQALAVLESIRQGAIETLQPSHWLIEVAAVVSRLQPVIAEPAIELLEAMELPVVDSASILKLASRLSVELEHHLFDTLYHAVALERSATLVTADRRYYRKAERFGQVVELARWHELKP